MESGKKEYMLAAIIPCWNCANYVGELINCLLNQTFSDWKAFFVDDICSDATAELIQEYSSHDSRLHYYKRDRQPKGAQTCRNIGMQLSVGAEFVLFLDADDLISPDCFEQRVRFMKTHPTVDFASFPMKAFKMTPDDDTYWGFGIPGRQDLILSLLYWKTLQIVCPSNIYRQQRLVEVGVKWDERLQSMQDADFNIQSITKGLIHSFDETGRIDYYYRQGQNTVSKRISNPSMYESHLYLIEKVTHAIRQAYNSRYDFYLEAYIVNFFDLFKKNRSPYQSLLHLDFVRQSPSFYLKIILFLILGMRGKKRLFKKQVIYSAESARTWSTIVTESLRNKIIHG